MQTSPGKAKQSIRNKYKYYDVNVYRWTNGDGSADVCRGTALLCTHHLFVLLQQRAAQVQLGAGVHRHQLEAGGGRAHKLHHGHLHCREGVGHAGLVPHRHLQHLREKTSWKQYGQFLQLFPNGFLTVCFVLIQLNVCVRYGQEQMLLLE